MKHTALVLSLALFSLGCPKNVDNTNVAGTDDEQMDMYVSQLEELRTRQDLKCEDWCGLKGKVEGISTKVCEIANRKTDRDDFQKRCVQSQEDVARYAEGCSSCKK